ncbi:porin [Zobellella taiwanensis]|uniref:Porin n=1 Tax=Zobellella taiwanensis TaxID=347535 RepID=A0A2P7RDN7_9GAMM|nr:porin [Zobellella taiwanensis]PSJ48335.1 porin [Zobellella taiwanensis]
MKKTILALTIPALFATSASAVTVYSDDSSAVDVYGRIQYEAGEIRKSDEKFGGEGEARLGINAKYNLNQDVDLIGKLEWQVTAESDNATGSDSIDARYAYLGFRFQDTTELTFGKSETPFAQLSDYTDQFNAFGAAAYDHNWRPDDQIRVAYAANGFDLRAGYAFGDANRNDSFGSRTVDVDLGEFDPDLDGLTVPVVVDGAADLKQKNQYALSAGYNFAAGPGDAGVVAAYERVNFDGNPALNVKDQELDKWGLGVNYALDGFYGAVVYGQSEQSNTVDADFWEAYGSYNVDAWTVRAAFNFKKADANIVGPRVLVEEYVLGAQYAFNAKTKMYAEYVIDEAKDGEDQYALGLQYNF